MTYIMKIANDGMLNENNNLWQFKGHVNEGSNQWYVTKT